MKLEWDFIFNIIMVILLIGIFWFLWFRSNNQERWKKVIFSLLALFVFTITLASNSIEAQNSTNLDNEIAKNAELTETISALETDHEDLQEKFDDIEGTVNDLREEINTLTKKNDELQKTYNSAQQENDELKEKITQRETDHKALQRKVEESEKATSTASSTKTKTTASNENSSKTKSNNSTETKTSNTDTSEKSSSQKNETSGTAVAADEATQNTGDCDIKGSVNGIYHVPGSTYYSRTKNVAQWFCSTEEAENAGYRAPKR